MDLIGSGMIGTLLAHAIDEGEAGNAKPLAVYDRTVDKAENLSKNKSDKFKIVTGSIKSCFVD